MITAIFIVEDDLAIEPEAGLKRVNTTQALLEEFFGGEFREGWSFVGLVFANRNSAHGICEECKDFVILGAEEMWEKLRRVLVIKHSGLLQIEPKEKSEENLPAFMVEQLSEILLEKRRG